MTTITLIVGIKTLDIWHLSGLLRYLERFIFILIICCYTFTLFIFMTKALELSKQLNGQPALRLKYNTSQIKDYCVK